MMCIVCRLSALAEKILAEFLAKASGGMGNGIPLPGMKVKIYVHCISNKKCIITHKITRGNKY